MNVLLYGLGKGTQQCEKALRNEHRIIGYTDSFSDFQSYHGVSFYRLDKINEISFDYLIITLLDLKVIEKVCIDLTENYKVPHHKIVIFWYAYNHERHKWKLETYPLETIECIILGNSHATYGFLENRLPFPTMNLAVPGQDAFYDYDIIQCCARGYGQKFLNLKYFVIDLYDYYFFNIDVSKGSHFAYYLYCGGSMAEHNKNPFQYACNCIDDGNTASLLFHDSGAVVGTELDEQNRWMHISPDEPLYMEALSGSTVTKEFSQTIEENIIRMEELLETIKSWKPDSKIFFTLLPRYIAMENAQKTGGNQWKESFYSIVRPLYKKFDIKIFDYKNNQKLSQNHFLWNDICHLNTIGGGVATDILNRDIIKNL